MSEDDLIKVCKDVLEGYPDKVNNYRLGKTGLLGMFAGEVMKKSRGTADPEKITHFLKKLLNEK